MRALLTALLITVLGIFAPIASAEELLLTCKVRDSLDSSAMEVEIPIAIDLNRGTATWGSAQKDGAKATITTDMIHLELPPFKLSGDLCSQAVYSRRTVTISRINGKLVDNDSVDVPTDECKKAYSRADRERPISRLSTGRCEKVAQRAF